MYQDLRYAIRMLGTHPGFSLTVVLTLGLGIGANVTMFAVVNGLLFAPLPYRDADRLVMVWNRHTTNGADDVQISGLDFLDYKDRATSFETFVAVSPATDNSLSDEGHAVQIDIGGLSPDFFQFIGREPSLGRSFTSGDEVRIDGSGPVIISHGLWTRRFGSDPGVLGRGISISGRPAEVIGVLPANFNLVLPEHGEGSAGDGMSQVIDAWRLLSEGVFRYSRFEAAFRVIGRLREGVTLGQAQEEMDGIAARMREEFPVHAERGTEIDLVPMQADVVSEIRPVVLFLFGAVGFVLLIACANVANLILVRAAHRQREVAVRAAMGAGHARLVGQLLTENALLAAIGTALGLLLTWVGIEAVKRVAPINVPFLERITVEGNVLWFAVLIGGLTTLLFGLIPALASARPDLRSGLTDSARPITGTTHQFRDSLMIAEIALSLVLLFGGVLLIRSFTELQAAELGFRPTSSMTVKVALPRGAYDAYAVRASYWNNFRREALSLPGVESVAATWPLPFAESGSETPYSATGGVSSDVGRYLTTTTLVSPGYFETMEAQLVDGRTFTEEDLTRNAAIVVVDDIVAENLHPGRSAVGQTFWLAPEGRADKLPLEIIGVVTHIRNQRVVGEERETIYRLTDGVFRMALIVRTDGDPLAALGGIRQVAERLDPNVPIFDARTFREYIDKEIAPTRFTMTLTSFFAMAALMLAAIGIYGVTSHSVAQREPELGVRAALGDNRGAIVRLVLGHGLAVTVIGIGLVMSMALSLIIQRLVVGVTPTDPLTLVIVSALLAAVAMTASYLPARRASRVDPLVALRGD
jgi:predicted permease